MINQPNVSGGPGQAPSSHDHRVSGKGLTLISVLLVLAVALLIPSVASGNVLSAVSLLFTVPSLAVTWKNARGRDRAERAAFAERIERVRRPPADRDR
jgi:hypothetical protein